MKTFILLLILLTNSNSFAADTRIPYVQEREISGRDCLMIYSKEGELIDFECR